MIAEIDRVVAFIRSTLGESLGVHKLFERAANVDAVGIDALGQIATGTPDNGIEVFEDGIA